MRYLTHLARETKARVMPSQRPSWLNPIAPMIQENAVESPFLPVDDSKLVSTAPAFEPSRQRETARGQLNVEDLDVHTKKQASPVLKLEDDSLLEGFSAGPGQSNEWNVDVEPQDRTFSAAYRSLRTPSMSSDEAVESQSMGLAGRPHERGSIRSSADAPSTLQSVFAEIERRQQELEVRYQEEQALARNYSSRNDLAGAVERLPRENDGARLNIGSIVVQVEPEPTLAALPQAVRKSVPHQKSNRWARSFLDR